MEGQYVNEKEKEECEKWVNERFGPENKNEESNEKAFNPARAYNFLASLGSYGDWKNRI